MKWFKNVFVLAVFISLFSTMLLLDTNRALSLYGIFLLVYLLSKMVLSFIYKPMRQPVTHDYKVDCVIPSYNEDGDGLVETLKSVLVQTYPINKIYVVDDCSPDTSAYLKVQFFLSSHPEYWDRVVLHRLEKNGGKREAQAWAFRQSNADVFFTIDSDSYIYPDALEELLKTFEDENVYAATGHINARNRTENTLTQLIDIRYDNAFRVERAAQSVTGNILTCSGPLSIYRREVVMDNLDHYLNQRFLGVVMTMGDDRCLTNYANKLGKTKYQSTAKCVTDVPNNMKQFLNQQIRWNKSFFRESLIALKLTLKRPMVAYWSMLELILFVLLLYSTGNLLLRFNSGLDGLRMVGILLAGVVIMALARNVHYIVKHPLLFLMSPLYAVIHIVFLQPLRLYALLTVRKVKWGTREKKG